MSKKHVLILLLCCLLPAAAIGAIVLLRVPVERALLIALVLLCPLSHLLMMKYMPHQESHLPGQARQDHPPGFPQAKAGQALEDKP